MPKQNGKIEVFRLICSIYLDDQMVDWANLCVLGYVLNIIGPFNCANLVCKGWRNHKKTYVDVKVSTYQKYHMVKHMYATQIQKLDLSDYTYALDELDKFVGLKILILNDCVKYSNKLFSDITKLNKLEDIQLGGCTGVCNENLKGLRACPNLRKLWMVNCGDCCVDDDGIEILCEFELEELGLRGCGVTDKGCNLLKGKLMRELWFWECEIGNEGLKSLSAMESLTTLGLMDARNITEFGPLNRMKGLEFLNIEGSKITDEGLCELKLTHLHSLNISECRLISNKSMVHISRFERLEELWLESVNITDKGVLALGTLKKLRELDLKKCVEITDWGMRVVRKMASLEILNLRYCEKLTNASMRYVGESRTIRELDIYGCELINDDGIVLLGGCHSLRELVTGQNDISSVGRDALRDLLRPRKLNIKWYEQYV